MTLTDVHTTPDQNGEEQTWELLNKNVETSGTPHSGRLPGKRHWQILNIGFLVYAAYYSRNSLSVAIVAMNDNNSSINHDIQTFNWTNKNIVLSAFFFGYVPAQILSGWLISLVGVKWLTVSSLALCYLFGLLTPQVAGWFEYQGVIVIRVLQGLTQGVVFPASQCLLAQWVPPKERSVLGGTVYAARPVATVCCMFMAGYIAASWYGWPMIFYSANGIGILWCISFALFSYDNPRSHPSISEKEQKYIEHSLGTKEDEQKNNIPWKAILTSGPYWATFITQTGFNWAFWTLQTQSPMYLKYVMKFDIEDSATLSALPYLLQWLLCYLFSFVSDYLLNKNMWSLSTARKTMNSIGSFIPGILLIIFTNTNPGESTKSVCLLMAAIAFNSATFCGFMVNQIDIAPRYASVLVGMSNGLAQVTGFLAPLFVQAIVKNETQQHEWKYVFYTSAGIYIGTGIIFIIFASGEVQYWNDMDKYRTENGTRDSKRINSVI